MDQVHPKHNTALRITCSWRANTNACLQFHNIECPSLSVSPSVCRLCALRNLHRLDCSGHFARLRMCEGVDDFRLDEQQRGHTNGRQTNVCLWRALCGRPFGQAIRECLSRLQRCISGLDGVGELLQLAKHTLPETRVHRLSSQINCLLDARSDGRNVSPAIICVIRLR